MIPVDFKGSNAFLAKPVNMTDEECSGIHCYKGVDNRNYYFFLTAWMPNKEDREAIMRGEPVFIKTMSNRLPPMLVFTTDIEGEINNEALL